MSFALALALLLALPACQAGGGSTPAPTSNPGSASTSSPASQVAAPEEKPVVDVSIFATNVMDIETAFGREILDYWGEQAGVSIKIEQPPSDGYQQKLQLLLASGDALPDLIRMTEGPSSTIYQQMVEEEYIIPMDDYLHLMPDVLNCIPERTIDAFRIDGKLYEIPLNQGENFGGGTYFRYDWLQSLGYDFPIDKTQFSIEEFLQICRDFTTKDPDGNGAADTYGFVMPNTAGWMGVIPDILLNATGSGRYWQEDANGNLTDSILTTDWDKTKEAVKLYKSMFEEGLVDPEVFLLGGEQVRDKLYRGVVGGVHHFGSVGSGAGFIRGIRQTAPEAILIWCNKLTGPNATETRYSTGLKSSGWVISSDSKHPDRVAETLNYICTDEGLNLAYLGIPGVHYESIGSDLVVTRTEEQQKVFDEFQRSRPWQWGFRGEATPAVDRANQIKDNNGLGEAVGVENYGEVLYDAYDLQISATIDLEAGFAPAKNDALINLAEEWKTALQKFLIGDADEAALDAMREKYMNGGYSDYIDQVNSIYQGRK
jgi:ABC-type glycerol-3-phosphate transport system substrate-binding protein